MVLAVRARGEGVLFTKISHEHSLRALRWDVAARSALRLRVKSSGAPGQGLAASGSCATKTHVKLTVSSCHGGSKTPHILFLDRTRRCAHYRHKLTFLPPRGLLRDVEGSRRTCSS